MPFSLAAGPQSYARVTNVTGYVITLVSDQLSLFLVTALLLDLVQKGLPVTKEQSHPLHEQGLVRGRYLKLMVSAEVAAATGAHSEYMRSKGVDNSASKELFLELLRAPMLENRNHRGPGSCLAGISYGQAKRRPCKLPAPKPAEGWSRHQRRKHFDCRVTHSRVMLLAISILPTKLIPRHARD